MSCMAKLKKYLVTNWRKPTWNTNFSFPLRGGEFLSCILAFSSETSCFLMLQTTRLVETWKQEINHNGTHDDWETGSTWNGEQTSWIHAAEVHKLWLALTSLTHTISKQHQLALPSHEALNRSMMPHSDLRSLALFLKL